MYNNELYDFINKSLKEGINYQVTILGNTGVIVEGHRGIRSYQKDKIVLRVSKNYISILGENLTITEVNDVDIFVTGQINSVVMNDVK